MLYSNPQQTHPRYEPQWLLGCCYYGVLLQQCTYITSLVVCCIVMPRHDDALLCCMVVAGMRRGTPQLYHNRILEYLLLRMLAARLYM